jgi:hypothetical protein
VAASDHNHERTLRAFADELRDVMLGDGWSPDSTSGESATAFLTIANSSETALVARQLACTAAAEALKFARGHADIDALLSSIRGDGTSTRLLVFEATLVPGLLATAGRDRDARAAITECRSRLAGSETGEYEQIAGRLLARLG